MTRAARVLTKAADLIEEHGLARGAFVDRQGRICAVEALWRAATDRPLYNPNGSGFPTPRGDISPEGMEEYSASARALQTWVTAQGPTTISRWSDTHEQAEVTSGLREVARLVDAL